MIIFTLVLLVLMEISLSFDNAVLNAAILQKMSRVWQRRFLTWGILVAVFGMRLIFPIAIVALAAHLSFTDVMLMALNTPDDYAHHLESAHVSVASFGGIFLLMVFLKFLFETENETHWIHVVESNLKKIGHIEAIEIGVALSILMGIAALLPTGDKLTCLIAGCLGIVLHVVLDGISSACEKVGGAAIGGGIGAFMYLEVLDASCSLDGVIGAFVLTNNIILIMAGLGIGALCIRSLTVYLVRGGVLKNYIYLEHGAHYGIGALAGIMLANMFYSVPEVVTGLAGLSFIGLSLLSSIKENRKVA